MKETSSEENVVRQIELVEFYPDPALVYPGPNAEQIEKGFSKNLRVCGKYFKLFAMKEES